LVQDAVIRNLEIIGEGARKVEPVMKENNLEVPWKEVSAMRNKPVHEYFGVDLNTVWIVLVDDIAPLKKHISYILKCFEG